MFFDLYEKAVNFLLNRLLDLLKTLQIVVIKNIKNKTFEKLKKNIMYFNIFIKK